MAKPEEKGDSIKIPQVSGLGGGTPGTNGAAPGSISVTQAVDAIGAMAEQLPALRKLGEVVGISLEEGQALASPPAEFDPGGFL